MIKAIILFIVGLVLVIKGGDWFVDGATSLARRFHIPELLIGATIVSIGTTLPEVMVSTTSAIKGIGGMAYGNAIGSVICNTALIAAITVTLAPAAVKRATLLLPAAAFFAAAAVFCVMSYCFGGFSRISGVILLLMFVCYIVFSVLQMKKHPETVEEDEEEEKQLNVPMSVVFLVLGAAMIAVGANLLVNNGTIIASALGVPETVIALTFVALGTSLPELVTAITSLAKGHGALSLGNVIGANLFNIVLVLGMSTVVRPFGIPTGAMLAGHSASLVLEIPVMLGVMLILCVPAMIRGKLARWQGILLLVTYFTFVGIQLFAFGA
ncbi:MAG: calcium/sodium antiporter [Clostridia bacterium]|nr:calcium/sodium antiporter [Clostridia bacterium]